jgi:hypothetical protein
LHSSVFHTCIIRQNIAYCNIYLLIK